MMLQSDACEIIIFDNPEEQPPTGKPLEWLELDQPPSMMPWDVRDYNRQLFVPMQLALSKNLKNVRICRIHFASCGSQGAD